VRCVQLPAAARVLKMVGALVCVLFFFVGSVLFFFKGAVVCVELSAAARAQDSRRARVRPPFGLLLLERR